jgi:hypothetical protein
MNDIDNNLLKPYKIIYKYNNDNKKTQYELFIYVGVEGKTYEEIFKKMEKLNLYDTLITLTNKEIKKLESGFGLNWFLYFFNTYHINFIFKKIQSDKKLKNKLLNKYDEDWIKQILNIFTLNIVNKKINYSYNESIKNENREKMGKKITTIERDEVLNMELRENNKNENILNFQYDNFEINNNENDNDENDDNENDEVLLQDGGEEKQQINDDEDNEDDYVINNDLEIINSENEITFENINEIEDLYKDIDTSKIMLKTNQEIQNIIGDKVVKNKKKYMYSINEKNDNSFENKHLEYLFEKIFVYTQYIFEDDTVLNIKNKITSSILNHSKYGESNYLIPSRIHMWSEYKYKDKIEKIILGHMWSKNNELLDIDIELIALHNYENLEGSINVLKNLFSNYGSKIVLKYKDDTIIRDYENYVMNNEIYITDIYNIFGLNYSLIEIKKQNVIDTLFKIYFPKISRDDINNIFDYLNKNNTKEEKYINEVFETIYSNNLMENEITQLIEKTRIESSKEFRDIYKDNNLIIQSNMFVFLKIYDEMLEKENEKNINKININSNDFGKITLPTLNLFIIFNDFRTSETYPFIQYNVSGVDNIIRYNEKFILDSFKNKTKYELVQKWFLTSPHGVSFKIKINELKYINVELNEIGKLSYKIIWSESDKATVEDLYSVHKYIYDLIEIINKNFEKHVNTKIHINKPNKEDFKFIFINSIQKYGLTNNSLIDYDVLTELSKIFYPYVALILNTNKSGAYLQFKRVSKYEIKNSIEMRIISYLRYKNYNEDDLIKELKLLFNLSAEKAKQEINEVKIKKINALNKLKKTDEIPSYKNPGTRIEMQGKTFDKYKIKIEGTKNIKELNSILTFLNSLLYIYCEIYINKNKVYDKIKDKLTKLNEIAKKRTLVNSVMDSEIIGENIRLFTEMKNKDKNRLVFKPDEGFYVYSRLCQNSGENNKKRPKSYAENDINKLTKDGYKFNKKTNNYEKTVLTKKNGKITIQTLKLNSYDPQKNKHNILYYSCDPENNNDHMYVGFLTKTKTPAGDCLPCCFKKNPFNTTSKEKINFYKKCMGEKAEGDNENISEMDQSLVSESSNEVLYILQDSNKILEYRIGFLPNYLEYFFNRKNKNTLETKNAYLMKTCSNGYYFKYGINQNNYSFINSLMVILDMTIQEIKTHIIDFFKTHDKDELYFMALNEGNLRNKYKQDDFLQLIENNEFIDYYYLKDILKIKGLFTKNGIYTLIFNKNDIKQDNKIKEEFFLELTEDLINDDLFNIYQIKKMDLLVFIKDGKYYYPIVNFIKENVKLKKKVVEKFIKNEETIKNIISFFEFTIDDIKINLQLHQQKTVKELYIIIKELIKNNSKLNDYSIKYQVIDNQFKCRYVILKNKLFIPVKPSGILNNLPTVCLGTNNLQGCASYNEFLSFEKTMELLNKIYTLSDKKINIKPIGIFYDKEISNSFNCLGIITSNNDMIPILEETIKQKYLDDNNLIYKNIPLEYNIDKKLAVYNKNNITEIDNRIKYVNQEKYLHESYQLFRFEFSYYINIDENIKIKEKIIELSLDKKKKDLENYILEICNKVDTFVKTIDEIPNINDYVINNQRFICKNLNSKDCSNNKHCLHKNNKCYFSSTNEKLYEYIIKITKELIERQVKYMEIIKEKNYAITDIVNFNNFNEYSGEKIIKNNTSIFDNFTKDIHMMENKKKLLNKKELDDLQFNNPLKDVKYSYIQNIIPFNYSILRAYVNGYYWLKHYLYEPKDKNLKYYSINQNEYLNLCISIIIDWLNNSDNQLLLKEFDDNLKKLLFDSININGDLQFEINKFIIYIINNTKEKNFSLLELFILNKIHKIPIVLLINNTIKYYIDDNNIIETSNEKLLINKNICINLENIFNNYPQNIEIIYYK